MAFSFIHISDIHLGRPFSNISKYSYDISIKNLYNDAVEKAFNNVIDFALLKNVDFVLISGDTFDNNEQDFKSKLILKEGLKKLEKADIKVFLICGNHDPISSYNKNTFNFDENSNIKIIGLNTQSPYKNIIYAKSGNPVAIIRALSFEENTFKENPIKYFDIATTEEKQLFNIALLHCDLDASKESPYAPCTLGELQSLNYDYCALGHIHLPEYEEKSIQYSGTIQGRNTKETGVHGIKYIKVENNKIIKNSLIPTDIIRFEDIKIDLSSSNDTTIAYSQIQENFLNFVSHNSYNCELFLVRLELTGNIEFFSEINEEFYNVLSERLKSDFNNKIYISEITNNTKPKTDEETLKEDDGIAGEIYRTIKNETTNEFFKTIETDLKSILPICDFSQEEYEKFKAEITKDVKDECLNLCNNIYYSENREERINE